SGSFIIEPPKVKPPSGGNRPPPAGNKGGGVIQVPKPPTRDSWWAKASPEERREWVFANFVEKSGLFELAPRRDKEACVLCNADGLISKVGSGGQSIVYLCTRCAGAQYDLSIKFR